MADLYGLSAADRDVLMRMIAREKSNYSANVRSLAPVPRGKPRPANRDLKWFVLYADLAENDSAEAYPTKWDKDNDKWIKNEDADRVEIYSTATGVTGKVDQFMPCWFNWNLLRWEVIATYGDTVDVVKVYHSGSDVGADVAANAGGVHPGQVKKIIAGVMTYIEDCWIAFVDDYDTEAGTIKAVNGDYYGPARLSGEYTHSAVTLPLYVLRRNFERIVRFELTSTLSLSGNAEAIILSDDDADWADTALAIQVYDWFAPEGMWAGIAGYRGYAIRREGVHASGRQKYDIQWMEQIAQTIQFTTTEYMGATTAGRVAVTVNWYDHQGKEPAGSVIVRDPQGQFSDVHSGAKGTAVYDYHNGYYRIVSCQRVALFATALLNGAACAGTMTIDGFAVRQTGDYVGEPPTTPTAATNTCDHAGLDNDAVLLRRTNNTMPSPSWEVVDVAKHSKTVMTDVRVDALTLQKKSITIYVELCDNATPSWTTWHTGGECP